MKKKKKTSSNKRKKISHRELKHSNPRQRPAPYTSDPKIRKRMESPNEVTDVLKEGTDSMRSEREALETCKPNVTSL